METGRESAPLLLESYQMILERHYTAISMKQHIKAKEFVKRYKEDGQNDPNGHYLDSEIPKLKETLDSITVDPQCFHAYFCSQLSSSERLLLASGSDSSRSSSNDPMNYGLPTPLQLQDVFDNLRQSVSYYINVFS